MTNFINCNQENKKIHITSMLFDFVDGNATTNLAVEWAKSFDEIGFYPEIIGHGNFFGTNEYFGQYRGIDSKQFSGLINVPIFVKNRVRFLISTLKYAKYLWNSRKNVALLVAFSTHSIELLIQIVAARMSGIPIIFFISEEQISLHSCPKDASFRKKISWLMRLIFDYGFLYTILLRFVTAVICITEELVNYLSKWGHKKTNFYIVPNIKHSSFEQDVGKYKGNFTHKDEFLLFYGGSIDEEKESLFLVAKVVSDLSVEYPRLKLIVLGGGRDAINLSNKIASGEFSTNSIFYPGYVSRELFEATLSRANLCVVLKKNNLPNKFNFPNKMTDYMAMRKPILLSPLPVHNQLHKHKKSALFADPESYESIRDAVLWALQNEMELALIGNRGRFILDEQLDGLKHIELMIKWLNEVSGNLSK